MEFTIQVLKFIFIKFLFITLKDQIAMRKSFLYFFHKFYLLLSFYNIYFIVVFLLGNLCMITGGRNLGRVGTVVNRERHPGSFDIVHIKDSQGHTFATR